MLTFIHCADIHLDSPLRGLERYEGAPVREIRSATRRAFENLVNLCIAEQVDFLLICGDIYDGEVKDFNVVLHFVGEMTRLRTAGIPVFLVRGNHDPADWSGRRTPLPDNVHEFSANHPETVTLERLNVALHGQSFPQKAVTDNLAASYPAPRTGHLNIGLLHTALDGREGFAPYAPCTPAELAAKGYDYWALGHVHHREALTIGGCHILFPGNLQGRSVRETGAKGCTLVRVGDDGRMDIREVAVDVLRWAVIPVAAGAEDDPEQVLERTRTALEAALADADGRFLAARVEITGASAAHDRLLRDPVTWSGQVRALALDAGEGMIWVEKVVIRTRPPQSASVTPGDDRHDALAMLAEIRAEWAGDEAALKRLAAELEPLRKFLPPEIQEGEDGVTPGDPGWLRETLERAEALALSRLRGGAP